MRTTRWILISAGLVACWTGRVTRADVPVTLATESQTIGGFELFRNGCYWWGGVGDCGEQRRQSFIRLRGVSNGATRTLSEDCAANFRFVTRDDGYAYFVDGGQLLRRPVGTFPNGASLPFNIGPAPGHQLGPIVLQDEQLYWSESDGTNFNIFRMNADGSSAAELVLSALGRPLKRMVFHRVPALHVFDLDFPEAPTFYDALFLLTEDGRLLKYDFNFFQRVNVLAMGVSDFTLRDELQVVDDLAWWFTGVFFIRNNLQLEILDSEYTGSPTTAETLVGASFGYGLVALAVDDKKVYWIEQQTNCAGFCIPGRYQMHRRDAPPTNSFANDFNINILFAAESSPRSLLYYSNLRSDGQWLYFIADHEIRRISTDAPPLVIDLRAVGLEAVQAVQDLDNTVPLIAGKETFVRGYASLAHNDTDLTGPFFCRAELRGWLNGIPLGVLAPLNNFAANLDAASDLATLRSDASRSFLFQVPPNWMALGNLTLAFTVNPGGGAPEFGPTPLANNTANAALRVASMNQPCLVFQALSTSSDNYSPTAPNSGFSDILRRAKSLMPVGDFQIYFRSGSVKKPVVTLTGIHNRSFDLPDDKGLALFYMALAHAFSTDPCPDTHWIGTVPEQDGGAFNGIGGARNVSLRDLVPWAPNIYLPATALDNTSVVRMDKSKGGRSGVEWNQVNGGHTLAHELGHNYGRFHVDQTVWASSRCGPDPPARPHQWPPFDHCTFGDTDLDSPATVFGFDPLTQSAIAPDQAGDLMSYADSHWVSAWTYNALVSLIGGSFPAGAKAPSPATQPPVQANPPPGPVLLVQGLMQPTNNTVELFPFYQAPSGFFDAAKVTESFNFATDLGPAWPYRLHLIDANGALLIDTALLLHGAFEDNRNQIGFLQYVPFDPRTRRVQVLVNDEVRAERWVSLNVPVLVVAPPIVDAAAETLTVNWAASDADGDPLLFTIQYSTDNAATWQTLAANYSDLSLEVSTRTLPGSAGALVRVAATDGLNAVAKTTAPFALGRHAPEVILSGVSEGQRLPFGVLAMLRGLALDAEDGNLGASQLQWSLTGPAALALTASGATFALPDLAPGSYTATLAALDSDGQSGISTRHFDVLPVAVPDASPAPKLDGLCADRAYATVAVIRFSLPDGSQASARFTHVSNDLYVCFTGLLLSPDGSPPARVGLLVDSDGNGGTTPQSDDAGFYVDQDGIAWQLAGNGSMMTLNTTPLLGFAAVVVRTDNGWNAEFRIADQLLGGWSHAALLVLAHDGTAPSGNFSVVWPRGAAGNQPSTWALAQLGALPAQGNRAPIAEAGASQRVTVDEPGTVTLDGTGSFDPDGDTLSFAWSQLGGPPVTLANASTAQPSFSVPLPASATSYRFQLVVNDGVLDSIAAQTEVTVLPATPQPIPGPGAGSKLNPTNGTFSGKLSWPGGASERCAIEASSNLVNWLTLGTNTVDFFRNILFNDPDASRYRYRFYRAHQLESQSQLVYSNGFTLPVGTEWSNGAREATPAGNRRFLGQFGAQTVSLTLNSLPAHTRLRITFDLFLIRTWDGDDLTYGPDTWDLRVANGPTLVHATFSNQGPQSYPEKVGVSYPGRTGAVENNTLGYTWPGVGPMDSVYQLDLTFDHLASTARLDFSGVGLQEIADESWGLDNVAVWAIDNP